MMYCPTCHEQAVRCLPTRYECTECGRSFCLRGYEALMDALPVEDTV